MDNDYYEVTLGDEDGQPCSCEHDALKHEWGSDGCSVDGCECAAFLVE